LRTALIVFSGEYDVTCRKRWRGELERLSCEPNVIIDFSNVTNLDATCMTELLRLHERRQANGFGRETVVLHRPLVRRLFELLQMQDVLRVVETLDEAVDKEELAPLVRHAFEGVIDAVRPAHPHRPALQRIQHVSAVGALY
jgi:anti-anti-sigma regulatory factor